MFKLNIGRKQEGKRWENEGKKEGNEKVRKEGKKEWER